MAAVTEKEKKNVSPIFLVNRQVLKGQYHRRMTMGLISLIFISITCSDQIVDLTAQFDSLDCLQKKIKFCVHYLHVRYEYKIKKFEMYYLLLQSEMKC